MPILNEANRHLSTPHFRTLKPPLPITPCSSHPLLSFHPGPSGGPYQQMHVPFPPSPPRHRGILCSALLSYPIFAPSTRLFSPPLLPTLSIPPLLSSASSPINHTIAPPFSLLLRTSPSVRSRVRVFGEPSRVPDPRAELHPAAGPAGQAESRVEQVQGEGRATWQVGGRKR